MSSRQTRAGPGTGERAEMETDKRILVVDGGTLLSSVVKELLGSGPSYEVHVARRGGEALSKMAGQPFDLIIADLRAPGIDGIDFVERVRANHPYAGLIVMTADTESDVDRVLSGMGTCGRLTPAFSEGELRSMVEATLAQRASVLLSAGGASRSAVSQTDSAA